MNSNAKYKEKGSIFQGSYKSRTVQSDSYLRQVIPYIMVKNVFELYPHNGLTGALKNFEDAWQWATQKYIFSSLPVYAHNKNSPIIEQNILHEIFEAPSAFKNTARDMVLNYAWYDGKEYQALFLEKW